MRCHQPSRRIKALKYIREIALVHVLVCLMRVTSWSRLKPNVARAEISWALTTSWVVRLSVLVKETCWNSLERCYNSLLPFCNWYIATGQCWLWLWSIQSTYGSVLAPHQSGACHFLTCSFRKSQPGWCDCTGSGWLAVANRFGPTVADETSTGACLPWLRSPINS